MCRWHVPESSVDAERGPERDDRTMPQAIRRRRAQLDREAYLAHPETDDGDWDEARAWGEA
jgi:hypothetical protein